MALDTQLVDIPIGGGLEQEKQSELIDAPAVRELMNMSTSKLGGYTQRQSPTSADITATISALIPRGSDVLSVSLPDAALATCSARNSSAVALQDEFQGTRAISNFSSRVDVSAYTIDENLSSAHHLASCTQNGVTLFLLGIESFQYLGDFKVLNSEGSVISTLAITVADSGYAVCADASAFYVFYVDGANLYVRRYASGAWGAATVLQTDAASGIAYRVYADYDATAGIVVAYTTTGNATKLVLISTALAVLSTSSVADSLVSALACKHGGSGVVCAVGTRNGLPLQFRFSSWTSNGSTISATANAVKVWSATPGMVAYRVAVIYESTQAVVLWETNNYSSLTAESGYCPVTIASAAWGTAVLMYGLHLLHLGTGDADGIFGMVLYNDTDTGATINQVGATVRMSLSGANHNFEILARQQQGTIDSAASLPISDTNNISRLCEYLTGSYAYAAATRVAQTASGTAAVLSVNYAYGHAIVRLTPRSFRSEQLDGCAYVAGGPGNEWDGASWSDIGFARPPDVAVATATVGGSMSNGTYLVRVTWRRWDARGALHESAPSLTETVVLAGGTATQKITLTIGPALFTENYNPLGTGTTRDVIAQAWITAASGTLFYLNSSNAAGAFESGKFTVPITTAADTTKSLLYTDSGELDNYPPPPTDEMALHGNRLWAINGEDGSLWPSKLLVTGAGPAWSPNLAIANRQPQRPVALASLGDRLAVFYPDAIGLVFGDGPDNLGMGAPFSDVTLLHRGVGAVSREVRMTSIGVVFQSRQGLSVLGVDGSVSPMPQTESDYFGATLVGVADVPADNAIVFAWSNGLIKVYDVRGRSWSTSSKTVNTSAGTTPSRAVPVLAAGYVAALVGGSGTSLYGFGTDSGAYDSFAVRTGWIKLAGVQGFERVRRLWLMLDDVPANADLTVELCYDYSDTVVETLAFANADLLPLSGYPLISLPIRPGRQRCTATAIRVSSVGTASEPFRLLGLRAEVGVKGRQRRNVAAPHTGA